MRPPARCTTSSTRPTRRSATSSTGHRGFERTIQVAYGLARDGRTNKDGIAKNLLELAVLAEWSEIRMTGAFRLIEPVLGILVRIAKRRGVDARLEERYVSD